MRRIFVFLVIVSACNAAVGQAKYQVFSFGKSYSITGLNDSGQVLGYMNDKRHAFIYSVPDKLFTDLHDIIGTGKSSYAWGVNNRGDIAGSVYLEEGGQNSRGFIIMDGVAMILEPLDGDTQSWAWAINDNRQVVGWSSNDNDHRMRGFVRQEDGAVDVAELDGGWSLQLQDINSRGQAVGSASRGFQEYSVVLYDNGIVTQLFDLSTSPAINSNGDIAATYGFNTYNGIVRLANSWGEPRIVKLRPPSNDGSFIAYDINDAGSVVGQSDEAVIWDRGAMFSVASLLCDGPPFEIRAATKLNNIGWVIVLGKAGESGVLIPGGWDCSGYVLGDANCDGVLNFDDIDAFVVALINQCQYADGFSCDWLCANDTNGDGRVDFSDIDGFVECLVNGECG